jgi:D-sedoheptulose 7-phosphate isomerase
MREALGAAIALHEQVRAADPGPLLTAVTAIVGSLRRGGKVMAFGNGGSAADAQHLAAELVGRFQMKRAALAAMALTTDTSVLTSVANDETFERVFARQIEALGRDGDVAVGISTSGRSANVTSALKAAELRGMRTIALTGGGGGDVAMAAEIRIAVPSDSTPRIQEVHRTLLHVICELVEKALL